MTVRRRKNRMPNFRPNKGLFFVLKKIGKKASAAFEKIRLMYYSAGYFLHLWIRMAHDKTYEKVPVYKNYTDKKYSSSIHKAILVSFVASFVLFSLAQSIFPKLFNLGAPTVQAGTNSKAWTTRGDFVGATPDANTVVSGTQNSDDANLTLKPDSMGWTSATNTVGAPEARSGHAAVWTGSKMIVWGGITGVDDFENDIPTNTGGVYDPALNSWTATSTVNAPTGFRSNPGFWLNDRMLVEGANGSYSLYDPISNTWTAATNAPHGYYPNNSVMLPMGLKYLMWSGTTNVNTGAVWRPNGLEGCAVSGGCWSETPTTRDGGIVLQGLQEVRSVWTGSTALIVGRSGGSTTVYEYNPASNTFIIRSNVNAPTLLTGSSAVWTGTKMIVYGNGSLTRHIYDQASNTWSTIAMGSLPISYPYLLWTGTKMITYDDSTVGEIWRPNGVEGCGSSVGCWSTMSNVGAPTPRTGQSAVWADNRMIAWGGFRTTDGVWVNDGKIFGNAYASTGVVTGLTQNQATKAKYAKGTIALTNTKPNNTTITMAVRASDTAGTLSAATFYDLTGVTTISGSDAACTALSSSANKVCYQGNIVGAAGADLSGKYAEARLTLATSDGQNTPTVDGASISYETLEDTQNVLVKRADTSATISAAGWTNENSVKVTADALDCSGCATSTGRKIEVEAVTVGSPFVNTATATGDYNDTTHLSTATLTGLAAGDYHIQTRVVDSQGRQSSWMPYAADGTAFRIEQTNPTISTLTIGGTNVNAGYAKSNNVDLTIGAADTGGSGLAQMRFSNDGTNWGASSNIDGTISDTNWTTYATSKAGWNLLTGDGAKKVYLQVRDNAGNISGFIHTSTADFTAASPYPVLSNITVATGSFGLTTNSYAQYGPNYIAGVASTPLAGKYVYNSDLGSARWNEFSVACTSQYCAIPGVDPTHVGASTLLSPQQANPPNFTTGNYTAQANCAVRGGRLPTHSELSSIYTYRATYGNTQSALYWTSTEASTTNAYGVQFNNNGGSTSIAKNGSGSYLSRCVADSLPAAFQTSGSLTSAVQNLTTASTYVNKATWTATVPGGTTLVVSARAGEDSTPDDGTGNWTAYQTLTSGADIANNSVLNGKQYLQYKVEMTGGAATPTLSDITFETSRSAPVTLDTAAPTAATLLTPTNNGWQGSASPTLTWTPSASVDVAKQEVYVDGVLSRTFNNNTTATTTPASALSEGSHTWYVKAYDGALNATNSDTWTVKYDATAPAAPNSFTINPSALWPTQGLDLAWDFSNNTGSPIEQFKVERIDWYQYNVIPVPADWTILGTYKVKTYTADKTGVTYYTDTEEHPDKNPDTVIEQGKRYAYRVSAKDTIMGSFGTPSAPVSGLTQDSIFDDYMKNVTVSPCDGVLNCSTASVRHKGFENKITWAANNANGDTGVGTTHYLIYRSQTDLNSGNYQDLTARQSYKVVGVLPYQSGQNLIWYDNDANNDGTTSFVDGTGTPITISAQIQALNSKTVASERLADYSKYYYRIVGVDANNNPFQTNPQNMPIFNESKATDTYDVNYAHQNGNIGTDAERTPDVTAPSIPTEVNPTATGIDDLNTQPDPTQGMLVSWHFATDNSGRTVRYQLWRALGNASGPTEAYSQVALPDDTLTSFQDKGLTESTWYYYKVKASDPDSNASAFSSESGKQTKNSQVPTTPRYMTVSATKGNPSLPNSKVGKEITISFSGSAIRYATNKITGYELYRSTTNYPTDEGWLSNATKLVTPTFTPLNISGYEGAITYDPAERTFVDTVASDTTTYYYRARALGTNSDGAVQSGLSSIQSGTLHYGWDTTPDITAPDLPAEVKVKDIHDDGLNYKRNIITWARIADSYRGATEDFKEYKIYRSNDGLTWSQICSDPNGTGGVRLLSTCTTQYPNPLYNVDRELGFATNYFMDLIPISESNQFYYYHVTSADDAATAYKYPGTQTVINGYSNESAPLLDSEGHVDAVSLNPFIAKPTICNVGSSPCVATVGTLKATLPEVGVSTAIVSWTTDQPADTIVEFRKNGTSDPYIGVVNRTMVTTHTITAKPLEPNTTYDYRIISRNSLANDVIGSGTDLPTLATTGFNITPGTSATTTSTAEINWTTNLDASSAFVEYQLQRQGSDEPQSGTAGVSAESLATNARAHKVVVKGLRSNRTYTYKIKSISKDGFLAEYPAGSFSNFKTRNYDSAQFSLAPASSNVADRNITSTTAQIIWQTANETTSWVDYGTKSGVYGISSGNDTMTTSHVVTLEGLVPGTKYYYHVRVKDANEVEFTSQEYSFTAVIKPKISALSVSNITPYTATISWETNVDTETVLNWGKTTSYGDKKGTAGKSKVHQVVIEGLEDNTEYHYQIVAHDEVGTEVVGSDEIVRTPLDTEGPKITNVKTDIMPLGDSDTTAQVIVSWTTNKPASTKVEYDEGIIGGRYTKSSTEDLTLNNSHTVIVKGLSVANTYHYRIVTKDKRGNTTISNDYTFVTPSKEQSVWQLIVKSLQDTFAWTKNIGNIFRRK
jgi:hypothetical protein